MPWCALWHQGISHHNNVNRIIAIFIQEIAFENIICKISAMLFTVQSVKQVTFRDFNQTNELIGLIKGVF